MNTNRNRTSRSNSTYTRRKPSSTHNPRSNGHQKRRGGNKKRHTTGGSGGSRFSHNNRRGGGHRHSGGGSKRTGRKIPSFDPSIFINKNPVSIEEKPYNAQNTFKTFGLSKELELTIEKMGITTPSPIQDQIIPEILNGNDVIGLAETGTGKTAAFLIPLIEKTQHEPSRQTLILTPTRELAIQIDEEFKKLSKGVRMYSAVCVGGINIRPQINALKKNNHFIIGTPGRVLDLIKRKNLRTENITTVVLDEADRMLDMGFIHDMRKILADTPKDRETLFFSATMTRDAEKVVNDFLNNPVHISVKKKDITNSIEQDIVPFEHAHKFDTLLTLLENNEFRRIIIFGSMKHAVGKLARELTQHGIKAESIHGNKTHGQRQRALNTFKSGNARVLVATDVAARGIHVDNVTHVINYDLPQQFEDYVHRIGRTGRGDKKGKALTFIPQRKT